MFIQKQLSICDLAIIFIYIIELPQDTLVYCNSYLQIIKASLKSKYIMGRIIHESSSNPFPREQIFIFFFWGWERKMQFYMPSMGNNKQSQASHSAWKKSLQEFKFLLEMDRKSKLPLAFLALLFTLPLRVSLMGRMKGTLNSDRLAMNSFTAFPETHLRFMATCLEISWCRNVGQEIKLYFPLSHFSEAQFPFITLYFLTQYVL